MSKNFLSRCMSVLSLTAAGALLFAGCGGGGSTSANAASATNNPETGSYRVAVSWPDSSGRFTEPGTRVLPENTEKIEVEIIGDDIPDSMSAEVSRPETTLVVTGLPAGSMGATIKALDASSNLTAIRYEFFKIEDGEQKDSGTLPLGIAITKFDDIFDFEPPVTFVPSGTSIPFQNLTDNTITITTAGGSVGIPPISGDFADGLTISSGNATFTENKQIAISGNFDPADYTMLPGWVCINQAAAAGTGSNTLSATFTDADNASQPLSGMKVFLVPGAGYTSTTGTGLAYFTGLLAGNVDMIWINGGNPYNQTVSIIDGGSSPEIADGRCIDGPGGGGDTATSNNTSGKNPVKLKILTADSTYNSAVPNVKVDILKRSLWDMIRGKEGKVVSSVSNENGADVQIPNNNDKTLRMKISAPGYEDKIVSINVLAGGNEIYLNKK